MDRTDCSFSDDPTTVAFSRRFRFIGSTRGRHIENLVALQGAKIHEWHPGKCFANIYSHNWESEQQALRQTRICSTNLSSVHGKHQIAHVNKQPTYVHLVCVCVTVVLLNLHSSNPGVALLSVVLFLKPDSVNVWDNGRKGSWRNRMNRNCQIFCDIIWNSTIFVLSNVYDTHNFAGGQVVPNCCSHFVQGYPCNCFPSFSTAFPSQQNMKTSRNNISRWTQIIFHRQDRCAFFCYTIRETFKLHAVQVTKITKQRTKQNVQMFEGFMELHFTKIWEFTGLSLVS